MPALSLVWRAADLLFALETASIVEVVPPLAARAVAGVPPWVVGVFDHRGTTVPLVDVTRLVLRDARESGGGASGSPREDAPTRLAQRIVVTAMPPPHADRRIGLRVDALLDLAAVEPAASGSHPGFTTPFGGFLGTLVETPWGLAQLVRPQELFDGAQWSVLAGRLDERQDGAVS